MKMKKKHGILFLLLSIAISLLLIPDITGSTAKTNTKTNTKTPKYIFLFIGDGMGTPQIQMASDYYQKKLSFEEFPVKGMAQTKNLSGTTDSAAAATAMASGKKTTNGILNKSPSKNKNYKTITEKLKSQKGFKIGIVSTVNLNHATPAGFYAHQSSRKNYYKIAREMIRSDFDYFAGGALKKPTGKKKNKKNIYELAENAGYKVVKTKKKAKKLTKKDGKVIVIAENLDRSKRLPYRIDASKNAWTLKDYVRKGIQLLDNDTGFFMMVEGGKIDMAGHANDAASSIKETKDLSEAVSEAVKFYKKHPDETLILVTGDHETGGLALNYKKTGTKKSLKYFKKQKLSYDKFNTDYVKKYKKNNTSFKNVLKDIRKEFGLAAGTRKNTGAGSGTKQALTDQEYLLLEEAYQRTLKTGKSSKGRMSSQEYIMYGKYEPLTVTVIHILAEKAGVAYSTYGHTGQPVPVYAKGAGSKLFRGTYTNRKIYKKIAKLTGVK